MGASAGVGEGAVFASAVMLDGMTADELFADRDLDRVADDGNLDLAASIGVADAVVRPGDWLVGSACVGACSTVTVGRLLATP